MDLSRFEALIGENKLKIIKDLNILIIGLGGVGGYTVESLVRCGISNITLVDGDVIKPSNLNRQIISNTKNIDKYKTTEWEKRIKLINPDCNIKLINKMIDLNNIDLLFEDNYDYIIDCCDTSRIKIELVKLCNEKNIKLVSCMGTAKKIDASKVKITTLDKTDTDPLAKKVRNSIKDKKIMKKVTVVYSDELPLKNDILGSTSYVPAVAGLFVTNYIINDIIKNT